MPSEEDITKYHSEQIKHIEQQIKELEHHIKDLDAFERKEMSKNLPREYKEKLQSK